MIPVFEVLEDSGPTANQAISLCLFESERLDLEKHLERLERFLGQRNKETDVLIFREPDFPINIPNEPGIRQFLASGCTGWFRHLYRYLGAAPSFHYEWVRFCGSDTPEHPILESLRKICEGQNMPLAALLRRGCTLDTLISGSCYVRSDLLPSLFEAILAGSSGRFEDVFEVDEAVLSDWALSNRLPVVWRACGPISNYQVQAHLLERFYQGPETVLVARAPYRSPRNHANTSPTD